MGYSIDMITLPQERGMVVEVVAGIKTSNKSHNPISLCYFTDIATKDEADRVEWMNMAILQGSEEAFTAKIYKAHYHLICETKNHEKNKTLAYNMLMSAMQQVPQH